MGEELLTEPSRASGVDDPLDSALASTDVTKVTEVRTPHPSVISARHVPTNRPKVLPRGASKSVR